MAGLGLINGLFTGVGPALVNGAKEKIGQGLDWAKSSLANDLNSSQKSWKNAIGNATKGFLPNPGANGNPNDPFTQIPLGYRLIFNDPKPDGTMGTIERKDTQVLWTTSS